MLSLGKELLHKGILDLLELTSLYQLLLPLKYFFIFLQKSYFNEEEVNCTEPSLSVRIPSECQILSNVGAIGGAISS